MNLADTIIHGNFHSVAKLIETSAVDVNEIDAYGFTPLIEAAIVNRADSVAIAELLLTQGADIEGTSITGQTALHWAVENNNLALCKCLLEHKADPNAYNLGGQPVLVMPVLREQEELKYLLYQYGADLYFAQDFINAKLLAHRYELQGKVDIVNSEGAFIELNLEGFFLEFTISIIKHSLQHYRYHFAAKEWQAYFGNLEIIINAFEVASELIQYQQYSTDLTVLQNRIDDLLDNEPLIIPVAHRGHATTFVKYKNIFIRCDRGELSKTEGSVVVYKAQNPCSKDLIKSIIYKRQSSQFIRHDIYQILGLEPIAQLPLSSQITGNCSWSNVEAAIPALFFLIEGDQEKAMQFYKHWQEWDKDIALHECIQSFYYSTPVRKASKAALLGAILFQAERDLERAKKIASILTLPEYDYVLKTYFNIYQTEDRTPEGWRLKQLLEMCDVEL